MPPRVRTGSPRRRRSSNTRESPGSCSPSSTARPRAASCSPCRRRRASRSSSSARARASATSPVSPRTSSCRACSTDTRYTACGPTSVVSSDDGCSRVDPRPPRREHGQRGGNASRAQRRRSGRRAAARRRRAAHRDRNAPGRSARAVAALCSPYLRAVDTASIAVSDQRMPLPPHADERLRDRELGILDTYTHRGVVSHYPQEDARRTRLGKFYYRPPGGESWADVALRLRSLLADLDRDFDGARLLIVAHDAIIMNLRYVCEGLTERHLLELAGDEPVVNGAVTVLERPSGEGVWSLGVHNSVEHLS